MTVEDVSYEDMVAVITTAWSFTVMDGGVLKFIFKTNREMATWSSAIAIACPRRLAAKVKARIVKVDE